MSYLFSAERKKRQQTKALQKKKKPESKAKLFQKTPDKTSKKDEGECKDETNTKVLRSTLKENRQTLPKDPSKLASKDKKDETDLERKDNQKNNIESKDTKADVNDEKGNEDDGKVTNNSKYPASLEASNAGVEHKGEDTSPAAKKKPPVEGVGTEKATAVSAL